MYDNLIIDRITAEFIERDIKSFLYEIFKLALLSTLLSKYHTVVNSTITLLVGMDKNSESVCQIKSENKYKGKS